MKNNSLNSSKSRSFIKLNSNFLNSKRSQVTIFVILAIAFILIIVLYFIFRGNSTTSAIPKNLEPVFNYYRSCIDSEVKSGTNILGQTGGYLETPDFSPGSIYMPFSSQLDFLGIGVPYWYYISGNGIVREQVPSVEKMQSQLNNFVKEGIEKCDFSQFREQGFEIDIGSAVVESTINDNSIDVNIKQDLDIRFENSTWSLQQSKSTVPSNLGKFYNLAKKIYTNEKDSMFLENYGVDTLRLYAPVDGSDISCVPKIWRTDSVRENLTQALEANVPEIKINGNYYTLSSNDNKYFVKDIGEKVDVNVNFMYLRNWPMKFEVWPSEDGLMQAEPIGLQEGLGMLGFCYVPYHFVYDLAYPVLIQIYSGDEMFQFPVVVYINKNQPRVPLDGEALPDVVPVLCQNKLTNMTVSTYNTKLDPISAKIQFKCFDTTCDIGNTKVVNNDSVLFEKFPQCVNGYVIASADGYEKKRQVVSEGNSVTLILNKKYHLNLTLKRDGSEVLGNAIVVISNNDSSTSTTLNYPDTKGVDLVIGQYNFKVYLYSNTSINLKGSTTEKCVDVPKSGVLGFFGSTEKKCFPFTIPDQTIDYAISGGGSEDYYVSQSELEKSNNLEINTGGFGMPRSVQDLQINYNSLDSSRLGITFS